MQTTTPTRLFSDHGVELWRLAAEGPEQYAVRTDSRRARLLSSLAAAEALVAEHIRQAKLTRAH